MKIKNPKIIIAYNRFLDPIFKEYTKNTAKEFTIPSISHVQKNIRLYRLEWKKYEQQILTGMQKITGLKFFRNQIDVHIVSVNARSFSRPIIMKSRYSKMDFINILTHELIHCLFADNRDSVNEVIWDPDYMNDNLSDTTNNHIVLHAMLKYIYLDTLKDPKRLKADIRFCKSADYKQAWQIVEKNDHKELIKRFRQRYMRL